MKIPHITTLDNREPSRYCVCGNGDALTVQFHIGSDTIERDLCNPCVTNLIIDLKDAQLRWN